MACRCDTRLSAAVSCRMPRECSSKGNVVSQTQDASDRMLPVIGVVGAGLIGGSIIRRMQQRQHPVIATDADPTVRDALEAEGIVVVHDVQSLAQQAGLVIVAVPPDDVASTVQDVAAAGTSADLTIIDVSSTKTPIVDALGGSRQAISDATFLLTHPMAGRERGGFTSADPELFTGAAWIVCPHPAMSGTQAHTLHTFIAAMGARMCWMHVDFHERFTAFVSHLPHLLAFTYRAMLNDVDPYGAWRFAGGSLQDLLRIASADRDLWKEILAANADEVTAARDDLIARLRALAPADAPDYAQVPGGGKPAEQPGSIDLPLDGPIGSVAADALAATGRAGFEVVTCQVEGESLTLTFGRD